MREPEPTIRSRELGLALSRAVEAKGMNGTQLARRMGWSHVKVSRMFSGRRGCNKIADIAGVLAICDIVGPKRDELLEIAERAKERGWWQEYGDRLPIELRTLIDYEDAAIIITSFENVLVPGLLQTVDYMRAYMQRTPAIPAKEIPNRIEARCKRQRILDRRWPAKFVFYIGEYALSRTGPGREIMSEQVHHLLRMTVRPYVEIRVIPDAIGFHAGQIPFKIIDFVEFHPVVFLETHTSVLFLERPDTITAYRRIAAHLNNVALAEEQSREWLATLATVLGAPREDHDEHAPALEEEFPHGLG